MAELKTNVKQINTYPKLLLALVILDLILSVIFIALGYLTGNIYFRGVGVGLLIAWVTGGIAFLTVRARQKSD